MTNRIISLGTERGKTFSIREVNKAIRDYAMRRGPLVEFLVLGSTHFHRGTEVKTRNGNVMVKLLSTGTWEHVRGVMMD